MKKLLVAAVIITGIGTVANANDHSGQPANPGQSGQTKAFYSDGFQRVLSDKGLVAATYLFGNKGKGNGSDPDPLGLASDHDPGTVGGEPDTSR